MLAPGVTRSLVFHPLKPGTYKFFDDFHPETAQDGSWRNKKQRPTYNMKREKSWVTHSSSSGGKASKLS